MDVIDKYNKEALEELKERLAAGYSGKSLRAIFRTHLVFWETEIKPFCVGDEYYKKIQDILARAGHEVTTSHIGFNLSQAAKDIGFDRKTKKLDGRKAGLKKMRAGLSEGGENE
ncbi:hypothetical protein [Burkholderia cenocepacia]|uniref:hypothetical protein n=1 Tax=Burkholderia cenocepacia TaxID=95486 RepID=UPI00192BF678|nr:hypothetical protein [Burkholderia cenocepacia]